MTPQSITNKAMWGVYNPFGELLFGTLAYTKEESEHLLKTFYNVKQSLKDEYKCMMVAIDIVPVDAKI